MAETAATQATTEAPQQGGFPPFDGTTFPSQIFWLVVTFAFLF
ncbi:MAG: ATP F0F1 synthase subunit B, partial [Alphaproteobacteria bacterium]|nr:ATP F0F1 synthase subunit B [Alphaproteobacteria bacterium]